MEPTRAQLLSKKKLLFEGYHVRDAFADGEGVIVYVLDSGHNPDRHPITGEQIFFPGKVEFPQQSGDVQPAPAKVQPTPGKVQPTQGKVQPTQTKVQPAETKNPKEDPKSLGKNKFKIVGQPVGPKVRDITDGQHGPVVGALIGASKIGVAPRCRIAQLRITTGVKNQAAAPQKTIYIQAQEDSPDIEECISSCRRILTYHKDKHAGKPAVVNCSFSMTYKGVYGKLEYLGTQKPLLHDKTVSLIFEFQKVVKDLIDAGFIVVTGAGNNQQMLNASMADWKVDFGGKLKDDVVSKLKDDKIFCAPQCFENVIVAGGLNRDGEIMEMSGRGKLVSHYVLAEDLLDPFYDESEPIAGTSFGAAFLSGIIASILSSRYYAEKARTRGGGSRELVKEILEEASSPFHDGKGNLCRAFLFGPIVLKTDILFGPIELRPDIKAKL